MEFILILLALAGIIGLVGYGIRSFMRRAASAASEMLQLVQQGAVTTAEIVTTERRRMAKAEYEYFVTYAFRDRAGNDHSREERVSATHFDDYQAGQGLEIVYLPSDPTVSATREMVDRVRNTPPGTNEFS